MGVVAAKEQSSESPVVSAENAISVDVFHGMSEFSSLLPKEILRDVAEYRQKSFQVNSEGRTEMRIDETRMHDDRRQKTQVPTGLVKSLVERLRASGFQVTVNDRRVFGKAHRTDGQMLHNATGDDRRLLKALKHNPLAQIEVKGEKERLDKMQLAIEFFPNARIIIPVAQYKTARRIVDELEDRLGSNVVGLKIRSWPKRNPRVVVTTSTALRSCETRSWDIVLLPDPATAVQDKFADNMGTLNVKAHRCYSFVPTVWRKSDRDRVRLEAMSGPPIFQIAERRPAIEFLWLDTPYAARAGSVWSERNLEWKRATYCRNSRRNEFIASVARAFRNCDLKKLRRYGVRVQDGTPCFTNAEDPAVAVIVESLEHGRELSAQLEGWELVHRKDGQCVQASGEAFDTSIITIARAAHEGFSADVAIYAAGGTGHSAFQQIQAESHEHDLKMPALIVDFNDTWNPFAERDSKTRKREYRNVVW